MNQAEWQAVESAIEEGDVFAVDDLLGAVEKSDYPALIERYRSAASWAQKDVVAQLLATHSDPSLVPIFLDYMQVPITEEMQMFALAQMMRHFGEEYDQFNRYFSDYDLMVRALGEILAKHGLARPAEPEAKTSNTPAKKQIPLTDIPLTSKLAEDIAPKQLLLVAIERQDRVLLERAIARGADASARITHPPLTGCSVLMGALNLHQSEMALRLIDAGADVTARRSHQDKVNPERGQTALWWAMSQTNMTVVNALLAAGAPVDCPDAYGKTPLLQAVGNGKLDYVDRLLKAGADLQQAIYKEIPPLYVAAKAGDLEMVRYFLDIGEDPNARHLNGGTALLTAVYEGYADIVRCLLEAGADPNVVHLGINSPLSPSSARLAGMTPLAFAIRDGRIKMVKLLIRGGANRNLLVEKPDGTKIALLDFATKKRAAIAALLNDEDIVNAST